MNNELLSLTSRMHMSAGAPPQQLHAAAHTTRIEFPADYVEFMLESNGAEGPVGRVSHA
jgi:hypothetical protein